MEYLNILKEKINISKKDFDFVKSQKKIEKTT